MFNISIEKSRLKFGPDFSTKLLKPKSSLYPKFWKNDRNGALNPIVSRKLMEIADKIIASLKIGAEPKDIIITGSIVSYNWHAMSDIDLHILYDFEEINEDYELVKKALDQTRINWNRTHNITIAGKEVELYFQHAYEPHESNGIWSLELEKWLAQPVRLDPEIDLLTTEKKAEAIAQNIEHLYEMFSKKDFKDAYEYAGKIKDKIAKMRQAGLNDEGIYSPENLAFKMLRNAGYLEKLSSLKIEAYDRMMSLSLESNDSKKYDFNNIWRSFSKKDVIK